MIVTRLAPPDLEIQPLSSYELQAEVTRRFEAWSPAIFIGYNTIRFDEEMLRHGLFAALQDPYVTQLNSNMRADTLIMLHTVHLLAPGCITIPMVAAASRPDTNASADAPAVPQMRPSFRLGDIARANGISLDEADAHDALADVKATIEVAKLIRARAPDIFSMMLANASKSRVLDQLNQLWQQKDTVGVTRAQEAATGCGLNPAVFLAPEDLSNEPEPIEPLLLGHVFGPSARLTPILFIGMLPENKNAAIIIDLTVDPDEWLHCDAEALGAWVEQNPRAFQTVRINAFPILAPFGIAADHRSPVFLDLCGRVVEGGRGVLSADQVTAGDFAGRATGFELDQKNADVIGAARFILAERMMRIVVHLMADPQARDRVASAFAARQKVYPLSSLIEENLYSGFQSTAERMLAHRMHAMSIPDRVREIPALQDARLRGHAWRWVFAEDPEALPPDERQRMTEWLHQRVRNGGDFLTKLPYMTTPTAMESVIDMHVAERDSLASLTPAERASAMAQRQESLDYLVFIDRSAEEMMEQ